MSLAGWRRGAVRPSRHRSDSLRENAAHLSPPRPHASRSERDRPSDFRPAASVWHEIDRVSAGATTAAARWRCGRRRAYISGVTTPYDSPANGSHTCNLQASVDNASYQFLGIKCAFPKIEAGFLCHRVKLAIHNTMDLSHGHVMRYHLNTFSFFWPEVLLQVKLELLSDH